MIDSWRIFKDFDQNVRNVAESKFVLDFIMVMMMMLFSSFLFFIFLDLVFFSFLFFSLLLNLKKHFRIVNFVSDCGYEVFI
jgi:hypothetical protein